MFWPVGGALGRTVRRCRALPGTDDGSGAWFPSGWPGRGVRSSFKPGIVLKDAPGYKLQENVHFTQLGNRQNPLTWTFQKGQISVPPENRQKMNLPKDSLVTYHWTQNLIRNRNLIISIVQIPILDHIQDYVAYVSVREPKNERIQPHHGL